MAKLIAQAKPPNPAIRLLSKFIDSRLIFLALLILIVGIFPSLDGQSGQSQPLPVVCKADRLNGSKCQRGQPIGCPLLRSGQNTLIYKNEDPQPNQKELIVDFMMHRVDKPESMLWAFDEAQLHVFAEGKIQAIDKKTDQVVDTIYSDVNHRHFLATQPNEAYSGSAQFMRIPMNPDHYYLIELKEVRAYNNNKAMLLSNYDALKTGRLEGTIFLHASDYGPFDRMSSFQTVAFWAQIVLIAYFLFRLAKNPKSLIDVHIWVCLVFNITGLLFTYPYGLPVRHSIRMAIFTCGLQFTLDCFLLAKLLPQPLRGCFVPVLFFINGFIASFAEMGTRNLSHWNYRQTNFDIPTLVRFRDLNTNHLHDLKYTPHLVLAAISYIIGLVRPTHYRKMVPIVFLAGTWWTYYFNRDNGAIYYIEDERTFSRLYYLFGSIPVMSLILQFTALAPTDSYLGLPALMINQEESTDEEITKTHTK